MLTPSANDNMAMVKTRAPPFDRGTCSGQVMVTCRARGTGHYGWCKVHKGRDDGAVVTFAESGRTRYTLQLVTSTRSGLSAYVTPLSGGIDRSWFERGDERRQGNVASATPPWELQIESMQSIVIGPVLELEAEHGAEGR